MPSNDDDDTIIRRKIKAALTKEVGGAKVWHWLAGLALVAVLAGLALA